LFELGYVRLGYGRLAHAEIVINSGVINIPPQEFQADITLVILSVGMWN